MSIKKTEVNFIKEVASRFRAERLRLGMSQDDVASLCGVTSRSILSWESGVKIPSHYLAQLARHGFDAGFVLTGILTITVQNTQQSLTPEQKALLGLFSALSKEHQKEILQTAEEKKRLNELEEIVFQLQKKVG
jgi:transcriptional regulator with XRE-family HTH domain